MRTTVLGLGNLLLSDEGVGVRVVEAVEAELVLIGIVPGSVAHGIELTSAVAAAVGPALGLVAAELERLGHRPLAISAARAA